METVKDAQQQQQGGGDEGDGQGTQGRAGGRPWAHHHILHREPEYQMPRRSIVHEQTSMVRAALTFTSAGCYQ